MHRSVAGVAVGGLLLATIAAVLGLWLPARQQRQDAAWGGDGQRAVARVELSPAYAATTGDGRTQVCSTSPTERCLVGPGDPAAQVATVTAALAAVATGPVQT